MLGAWLPNAKGPPDVMWCLVPITDMKVDQDTWFTSGLQGTGSKTVRIERPVFVPDHRMLRFAEIVAGTVPGKQIDDNNMSKFGFTTFGPTALVSPVLGMAQGALDCFIEMAKTKVRAAKPGMIVPMAASPMIQNKIGAASATVESAFTLLLTSVAAAEDKVRSDTAARESANASRSGAIKASPQSNPSPSSTTSSPKKAQPAAISPRHCSASGVTQTRPRCISRSIGSRSRRCMARSGSGSSRSASTKKRSR